MQAQTQDQHNGLAGTNGHRSDEPAYPELFKPITIGKCKIPNRIVMAPMNVLMSQGNLGYVNDQQLAYYAARAKGGTGLIITECVLGTRLASQFPYTSNLHLFDTTHVAGLAEIVETVHAFGSKVFIQLSVGFGRQGHNPAHLSPPAPSPIPYETDPTRLPKRIVTWISKHPSWVLHPESPLASRADMPREMSKEEIHAEIEEYGRSCRLAVMAGFDGIELHAPHGYLEHQFLSPRSNKRTDEYGGSLENRMRFVVECYESARGTVGNAVPIGMRISGDEHLDDGIHHDELKVVVERMGEMGIDYLHMSDGSYEATSHFFPAKDATMLDEAASFKSVLPPSVPVICVSIHDPRRSSKAISEGKIDMVSLGRQMLVEPDYANNVRAGKDFQRCDRCCQCLMRTTAGLTVRCRKNPNLGRERYMPEYWRPAGREVGVKVDVVPTAPAIPCPGLDELLAAQASDELAQVSA
jgi:2,4-dienoyl-CoA reductase-like NADH-dependent reductase (Old Yellow Enzyme family)